MPTRRETRFDFRGGLNLAHSPDVLDQSELRNAQNAVLTRYGAVLKRPGTQRVHDAAIGSGAKVFGMAQWYPASGRQLVAISNGNLYHKEETDTDFTEVSSAFSTTVPPTFAEHIIAGTPTLYIADGTLRKWNGSVVSAVGGAPNARIIKVYKTRLFAVENSKTLFWSRVSNPEDWSASYSGSAPVETYDAEAIVALEVVGSSLLIIKQNSIARFTGVAADDIRIDQQTEGISPDIGTIAPRTVTRVEEFVFMLTDRGPYAATEAGVQALGVKIEPAFDGVAYDYIDAAVAVHHRGRREVWVFVPEAGETENNVGYCFNYRLNAWTGPWYFGGAFNVSSVSRFEHDNLEESVMLGGYDGFVREGAVTTIDALDDVLRVGTGGEPIEMILQLPTLFFGSPWEKKRLNVTQAVSADLGKNGELVVGLQGDYMPAETASIISKGSGDDIYDFRPGTQGRRMTITLSEYTKNEVSINGLELEADLVGRGV